MKKIQIMLMLLWFQVCNVAYGAKLPEFYGLYAVDGNTLIELKRGVTTPELSLTAQFIFLR